MADILHTFIIKVPARDVFEHMTTPDGLHKGWLAETENFKFSSYCWAMYLRIMKRKIEHGEDVPYEKRLSV